MPKLKDKPRRKAFGFQRGKLLTIKEVANYLRVSERSVLRYIEAGRLKAVKVGNWRVKERDLELFLNKNSNIIKRK